MEALPIETERLLLRQFAVEDAEDAAATTHLTLWTTNTAA